MLKPCFACCVISHPDDDTNAQETAAHLVDECQFPVKPELVRGIRPPPAGNYTMNHSISSVHARCLCLMNRQGCVDRGQHILIIEDDCRFTVSGNVYERVCKVISRMEKLTSGWHSLHLGHVPLGPTFPVCATDQKDVIVWSALPFAGHAYLINHRVVRKLASSWGMRPYNYEGMMGSPLMSRFAIQPPMATQIRRPKELRQIDETVHITSWLDFKLTNEIVCAISLLVPLLVMYGVVQLVLKGQ